MPSVADSDDTAPDFPLVHRSILDVEGERVIEHGRGIREADTVLCKIGRRLVVVPLEI